MALRVPEYQSIPPPPVIGIDLGTTNSCVAVYQNGQPKVVRTANGSDTTPSFVAFENPDGIREHASVDPPPPYRLLFAADAPKRIVGQEAKDNASSDPENTVFAVKRIIGRRFNEDEVRVNAARWPFKLVNVNNSPVVEVTEMGTRKCVKPEEISAEILKSLKGLAEDFLGIPSVTKAVITVPANFCDAQKRATKAAGELAGLEVIGMINEPTAAAVAYGLQNRKTDSDGRHKILVFDFGGGTLDVSIIKAVDNSDFTVLSTAGDMQFGGEDFDQRLLELLVAEFEAANGPGLRSSAQSMARLRDSAELAKKTLSGGLQAKVVVNSLFNGKHFKTTVTREQLEHACADLFGRILAPVERALRESKTEKEQIGQVVLVGGSSRIPKVIAILTEYFSSQQIYRDISADGAIAMGAAVYAHILQNESSEIKLQDIIPRSLGVGMADGSLLVIIPKHSKIPAEEQHRVQTSCDHQRAALFEVYEGEDPVADRNHRWASLVLKDIRVAARGEVKFEVKFKYDLSGILHVDVAENDSDRRGNLVINMK
ncbi:Heat shock 70 kDa protein IV [Hypsibius exemplaris]|uniref:Heat shock 70 kDa protein IV n=1 Tax=Hypsibius exemplaris TaxID=2072580 RepID=A0A1W0X9G3_HYPEX|nr:Heat shock 70 kDa protein IV [Hypsibius exemplaris]